MDTEAAAGQPAEGTLGAGMRFAQALAHTLDGQEIMLKIQTMNLYEIEENSRERMSGVIQTVRFIRLCVRLMTAWEPICRQMEEQDQAGDPLCVLPISSTGSMHMRIPRQKQLDCHAKRSASLLHR